MSNVTIKLHELDAELLLEMLNERRSMIYSGDVVPASDTEIFDIEHMITQFESGTWHGRS